MAFGLDGEVVLEGSWLYAGTTRYRIAIVRRGSRYGSGDYEDPPEVAQDREAATFEVWYTAAGDPERFAAGGGAIPFAGCCTLGRGNRLRPVGALSCVSLVSS
jgi:hypothetical protein